MIFLLLTRPLPLRLHADGNVDGYILLTHARPRPAPAPPPTGCTWLHVIAISAAARWVWCVGPAAGQQPLTTCCEGPQ